MEVIEVPVLQLTGQRARNPEGRTRYQGHPILVDENFTIIDGWERVILATLAKRRTIEAVRADSLPEAADYLSKYEPSAQQSVLRKVDLLISLSALYRKYVKTQRARLTGHKRADLIAGKVRVEQIPTIVEILSEIVGGTSNYSQLRFFTGKVEQGDPYAMELVRQLNEGSTITINQAARRVSTQFRENLFGDVRDAEQQANVLAVTARTLQTAALGIKKLGSPLKVPTDEMSEYVGDIRKSIAFLRNMINRIEKDIQEGKQE